MLLRVVVQDLALTDTYTKKIDEIKLGIVAVVSCDSNLEYPMQGAV